MIKSVSTELEPIQEDPEYDSNIESLQLNYKELEIIGALSEDIKIIRILDLSHNLIYSLEGIEALSNLKILDLSYNKIDDVQELYRIPNPFRLKSLKISCNPLTNDPDFRAKIISQFDKLVLLDKQPVNFETRVNDVELCNNLSSLILPFWILLDRDTVVIETLLNTVKNDGKKLKNFNKV